MNAAAVLDRGRGGVIAVLIAVSLLLSSLPAAAGPYASRGRDLSWDFLDPNHITWERGKKNVTWEIRRPGNITWEHLLPTITWE